MLKAEQLLPAARTALLQGGWSEDRRVTVEATITLYQSRGFEIPETLFEIFSNLSGVEAKSETGWLRFSPERSILTVTVEDVQLLEKLTGEYLCPFGTSSCAHFFLGKAGNVISLDSDWLFFHAYRDVASLCNCILARDKTAIQFSRQLSLNERPLDLR